MNIQEIEAQIKGLRENYFGVCIAQALSYRLIPRTVLITPESMVTIELRPPVLVAASVVAAVVVTRRRRKRNGQLVTR